MKTIKRILLKSIQCLLLMMVPDRVIIVYRQSMPRYINTTISSCVFYRSRYYLFNVEENFPRLSFNLRSSSIILYLLVTDILDTRHLILFVLHFVLEDFERDRQIYDKEHWSTQSSLVHYCVWDTIFHFFTTL